MIGRPEWFARRKYGGWGLHPKTWQGWLYVLVFLGVLIIFHSLSYWDTQTRVIVTAVWALALVIDTLDIMAHLKKDEREKIHEAFAERNALWVIVTILSIGLAYQIISSTLQQNIQVDWIIIIALLAGVVVKAISNYRLEKKN